MYIYIYIYIYIYMSRTEIETTISVFWQVKTFRLVRWTSRSDVISLLTQNLRGNACTFRLSCFCAGVRGSALLILKISSVVQVFTTLPCSQSSIISSLLLCNTHCLIQYMAWFNVVICRLVAAPFHLWNLSRLFCTDWLLIFQLRWLLF
jgi:hypothetical protein